MKHTRRSAIAKSLALVGAAAVLRATAHAEAATAPSGAGWPALSANLARICRCLAIETFGNIEWHSQIDMALATGFDAAARQALLEAIDFSALTKDFDFGPKGRSSRPVDIGVGWERDGKIIKAKLVGIGAGHGIPPHVHKNMTTATLVLSGKVRIRQFNRLGDLDGGVLVRPVMDRMQTAGDWSSISSDRANLHWFTAEDEPVFLLNINVENLGGKAIPGIRVEVDDAPLRSDTHMARYISKEDAEARYG
ncbi:MAG: hypothetical protein AAGA09_05295 [Pseudomonadota bacterium]